MRIDKYLKVSRLIKRRTVANEVADAGRILVNGKPAKASYAVKVDDVIEITFGNKRFPNTTGDTCRMTAAAVVEHEHRFHFDLLISCQ